MFDLPTWKHSLEPRKFGSSGWSEHIPFAFDLVAALRPATVVELGTHAGESYFAFCQAAQECATGSRCYAVDTWEGDEHAGHYGEEVFQSVVGHNAEHYADFSSLIRGTFDDAANQFPDGTIDLLHIDGLHTYSAVRHDFEHWQAKVRPGGIILMHDTAVRREDFGVWRWWEEISENGNRASFEFPHGNGLGVFCPNGSIGADPFLRSLMHGSVAEVAALREHYRKAGRELRRRFQQIAADDTAVLQVYFASLGQPFSEANSISTILTEHIRETFSIFLPTDFSAGVIRVDPMRCSGIADLYSIRVLGKSGGLPIWSADNPVTLAAMTIGGTASAMRLKTAFRIVSFGNDPQVYLPPFAADGVVLPLQVEIDICVQPTTGIGTQEAMPS